LKNPDPMTERTRADRANSPVPDLRTAAADRPSAIASCLALATVGFVTSMGMPMVVDALIAQYGYSEGHAGYVASTEYLGMFAASVVVSSLILRVSRQKLALAGILIAIASNATSLFLTAFPHLLAIRFLSGLGCGMAYAVAVAVLAGTHQTVRNFMFLVFANSVANILVLYSFPSVLKHWHLAGIFVAYCGVLIATAFSVPWLPRRFAATNEPISERGVSPIESTPRFVPWLCLFAVFCFYMMIGAYWSFIVPIGVSIGFDAARVGQMLSAGILLSLISCLFAYWLSQRLGQSKPLLFALGIIAVTHIGAGLWFGAAAFLIGLGLVNFFWSFTDIYQFGTIANIDHSGVFASRIQGAQMFGYVISPAVAGWLLDHNLGYPRLLILLGAYVATAFATYTLVYTVLRRKAPALADAS
jgi:predicted MFS family arabinose efflux permease